MTKTSELEREKESFEDEKAGEELNIYFYLFSSYSSFFSSFLFVFFLFCYFFCTLFILE